MKAEITQFVKLVVATIKGDDAEATAIKIQRRATAAIKAQIAIKEANIPTLEDRLDLALEGQATARINNGQLIKDNEVYLQGLFDASDAVQAEKEAIKELRDEITILKKELDFLSK